MTMIDPSRHGAGSMHCTTRSDREHVDEREHAVEPSAARAARRALVDAAATQTGVLVIRPLRPLPHVVSRGLWL